MAMCSVPPADVEHNRGAFQLAVLTLRQAVEKHDLKDVIVAVEMTGTYHKPPMRAFRKAGFETRLVHPFASSDYRHGNWALCWWPYWQDLALLQKMMTL